MARRKKPSWRERIRERQRLKKLQSRRLAMESLEPRQMLSGSPSTSLTTLLANMTPAPHSSGDQPADPSQLVTLATYAPAVVPPDMANISVIHQFVLGIEQIHDNIASDPTARPAAWGENVSSNSYDYRIHLDDNGMLIRSWTLDFGDGSAPVTVGPQPSIIHTFPGPGTYNISVSASSVDGTYNFDTTTIVATLAPVAAVVHVTDDPIVYLNQTFSLAGNAAVACPNPGPGQTATYTYDLDWGDTTTETHQFTITGDDSGLPIIYQFTDSHAYTTLSLPADGDPFTVNISVYPDDAEGNPELDAIYNQSIPYYVVNVPPAVASIARTTDGPDNSNGLISATTATFNVNFCDAASGTNPDAVTNVTAANFALDLNGLTGTISSVSDDPSTGSGGYYSTWVVTVSDISVTDASGQGTLGLEFVNNGTTADQITDANITPLAGPQGNGSLVGPVYTVNTQLYWDATVGGDWNSSNANWRIGSLNGPLTAWVPGSDAVFPAGTTAVTIDGSVAANSITFQGDGASLTGGALDLSASAATVNVAQGTATIGSTISGSNNLLKDGPGQLTFTTDSLGSLVLAAGTVQLGGSGTSSTAAQVTINAGKFDLNAHDFEVGSLSGSGGEITDTNSTSGTSTLTDDSTATAVFNGVVLGGAARQVAVVKSNNVTLAGNETTTLLTVNSDALANGQPLALTASVIAAGATSDQLNGSVSFYDGATLLGTVNTNSSGQATYSPSSFLPGSHSLTAVYSGYQNFASSTSTAFDFTWTVAAPPAITDFALSDVSGTTGDNGYATTSDATLSGTLAGSGDAVAGVLVKFYGGSAYAADTTSPLGQTWTDDQGNFTYTPSGLGATPTVWARTEITSPVSGRPAYGPWVSVTFNYQAIAVAAVSTLSLQTVDSTMDGNPAASNPVLAGQLSGGDTDSGVTVVLTNGTTTLGYAETDSNGNFTFTPYGLAPGNPVTITATASVWDDTTSAYVSGTSLSYTFVPLASSQPEATITGLALANPTDSSGTVATDPTVTGQVSCDTGADGLTVQFGHYDGSDNWVVDGTTATDADGNFTYTPAGLTPGSVTLLARVKQWDYTARQFIYGAVCDPFTFTLQSDLPAVTSFSLLSDTSLGENTTGNDTLQGTVSGNQNENGLAVEFTIDSSTSFQDRATVGSDGTFTFQPAGLSFGAHTIVATPIWWDATQSEFVTGQSSTLTFTYVESAAVAPVIADLALANNLATSGTPEGTDPTVTGRIIAVGSLSAATIDLTFSYGDSETLQAETTTDANGNFSYTPQGVPPGAVSVEARGTIYDPDGQQMLVGDWSSAYSFTLLAETAPTISSLTLANNLATGYAAPHGTDPTVTGQISGTGALAGVTVQFEQGYDQNNNGTVSTSELESTTQGAIDGSSSTDQVTVIVGTTTTDGNGNFTYTPTGLPSGKLVEILARTKIVASDSSVLYSDWTPVTFHLDTTAPTDNQVTSLSVENVTGDSTTDPTTSNPTVTGRISGPGRVSGLTVEIDQNGDGLPDGTAVTDSGGYFDYTPHNLPEGHVVIAARTADDGSGVPGNWMSVGFIYSSDPDGSAALALAAAYQSIDAALQATSTGKSASQDAYLGRTTANQSALDTATASNAATRAGAVNSATATYNSAIASAQADYNSAIADATTAFQSSGDVNYSLADFAWPQAPAGNLSAPPGDTAEPQPPASEQTGMSYNLSADLIYQGTLAANDTTYQNAVQQAQTDLASAQADAEDTYESTVATARATADSAILQAELNYAIAIAAPYPGQVSTESTSQAWNDEQAALAQDSSTYYAEFAAATADWNARYTVIGSGGYTGSQDYNATLEREQADADYASQLASITYEQNEADAVATERYNAIFEQADYQNQSQQAAQQKWQQQNQANATYTLTEAIARALHGVAGGGPDVDGLDQAIAAAEETKAENLATAEENYTLALANAEATLLQDNTAAMVAAISAWNTAAGGTAWTTYQLALADIEQQYVDDTTGASLTLATDNADAADTQTVNLALAAQTEANQEGFAEYTREQGQADALRQEQVGAATAQFAETMQDLDLSRAENQALDRADSDYIDATANAELANALDSIEPDQLIEFSQTDLAVDEQYMGLITEDQIGVLWTQTTYAGDVLAANVQHTLTYATIAAKEAQANADTSALNTYNLGYHAAEKQYDDAMSGLLQTYDVATTSADANYSQDMATATTTFDTQAAGYNYDYATAIDGYQQDYSDAVAGYGLTEADDEAQAYQGSPGDPSEVSGTSTNSYTVQTAWDNLQQVTTWAATQSDSPWSVEQVALAQAQLDNVVAVGAAELQYARSAASAAETQTEANDSTARTVADAVALATKTQAVNVAAAQLTQAQTVATAEITEAQTAAQATTDHDKSVTATDQTYEDTVANEARSSSNAVNASEWQFEQQSADAFLTEQLADAENFLTGTGNNDDNATTYQDTVNTDTGTMLASQQETYQSQANALASAEQTRSDAVGQADVTWTEAVGQAETTLGQSVEASQETLAGTVDTEATNYATTSADETAWQSNQNATAAATSATAVAEAADARDTSETTAADALQAANDDATAQYTVSLDAAQVTATASLSSSPLDDYFNGVAQANETYAEAYQTLLAAYDAALATSDAANTSAPLNSDRDQYTSDTNTLNENYTAAQATADQNQSIAYATADQNQSIAYATADDDLTRDTTDAAAVEQYQQTQANVAYQNARADANAAYNHSVALAGVTEVASAATTETDTFYNYGLANLNTNVGLDSVTQSIQYAQNEAVSDTDVLQDQSTWNSQTVTAAETFAGAIGDAQVALAGSLGDAEVTYATSVGTAQATDTSALDAADSAYASAEASAAEAQATAQATADAAQANRQATAQSDLDAAQNTAQVNMQEGFGSGESAVPGLGAIDVAEAVATATAEQTYQIAATAADADRYSSSYNGTDATVRQAEAAAFAQWVSILGTAGTGETESAFVAYQQATAQAQADNDAALAEASAVESQLEDAANIAFTAATGEASVALATATATDQQTYNVADAAHQNTRRDSETEADTTRSIAYATADRQHAIDEADAQKAYQVAIANPSTNSSTAQTTLTAAQTEANTNQSIAQADADLTWNEAYAAANRQYAEDDASATATMNESVASDQQTYDDATAEATVAQDVADAQALAGTPAQGGNPAVSGYWDVSTAAENTQAAAVASANAQWWSAGYAASSTAIAAMATTLSTTDAADWAQYEADLAAANQSWWGDATSGAYKDYIDNATAVDAQYTAYQSSEDTAYLNEATAKSAANETDSTSTAVADVNYTEATNQADQSETNGNGTTEGNAVATEVYLDAVAQANHDYAVTLANDQEITDTTERASADSAAAALQATQLAAATSAYMTAKATADAGLESALATAEVDEAQATDSIAGGAPGADVVDAEALAQANETFAVADDNANATLQDALAGESGETPGLDDALNVENAQSYKAAMDAFSAADPSAWASFADAQAAASDTLVTNDDTSLASLTQTTTGVETTEENADASAEQTHGDADALSSAASDMATANSDYSAAAAQAVAEDASASAGQYQTDLPTPATPPTLNSQAVDAVLLEDYGSATPTTRYSSIISGIFAVPSAEPVANYMANYYSAQNTTASISGDIARPLDPTQDAKVVDGVTEYFNELTGKYETTTAAAGVVKGSTDEDVILCANNNDSNGATSGQPEINLMDNLATGHEVATTPSATSSQVTDSKILNLDTLASPPIVLSPHGARNPDDALLSPGGEFNLSDSLPNPLPSSSPIAEPTPLNTPPIDELGGTSITGNPDSNFEPRDPHPIPPGHALRAEVRYVNMAMRQRAATDALKTADHNDTERINGLTVASNHDLNTPATPSKYVDTKRIELAIALADMASQAMAEKQQAERKLQEDYAVVKTGDPFEADSDNDPLDARKEIPILTERIAELNAVITDAEKTWDQYQLDDVSVALSYSAGDITTSRPESGRKKLFKAENAGEFLPKDNTPNSLWILVDAVTWAIPAFRAAKFGTKVAATTAERTAARALGEGATTQSAEVLGQRALTILGNTCFAAGTPVLTPNGEKVIEDFQKDDEIVSRPDDDPNVPVRTSVVEKVFKLSAETFDLRVGGHTITTTGKHPFFVHGKGWVPAQELQTADLLLGHDGRTTAVESIAPTGRVETVYNLRVAFDHTYFVGRAIWGFSVWVHNAYIAREILEGELKGTWKIVDETTGTLVKEGLSEVEANTLATKYNDFQAIREARAAAANTRTLRASEEPTKLRLEKKLGRQLRISPHDGEEVIDDATKTAYDFLGVPEASKNWNWNKFRESIDEHLVKSNVKTVIDLTGFTRQQISIVESYIDSLSPELRQLIIRIGF